jgi:hypothetical protein
MATHCGGTDTISEVNNINGHITALDCSGWRRERQCHNRQSFGFTSCQHYVMLGYLRCEGRRRTLRGFVCHSQPFLGIYLRKIIIVEGTGSMGQHMRAHTSHCCNVSTDEPGNHDRVAWGDKIVAQPVRMVNPRLTAPYHKTRTIKFVDQNWWVQIESSQERMHYNKWLGPQDDTMELLSQYSSMMTPSKEFGFRAWVIDPRTLSWRRSILCVNSNTSIVLPMHGNGKATYDIRIDSYILLHCYRN